MDTSLRSALGRTLADKSGKFSREQKRLLAAKKAKSESWVRERAPGPGAYKIPGSVGKQPLSTMRNPGQVSFGTAIQRPKNLSRKDAPGPGAYTDARRDNHRFDSTMKRAPVAKMKFRTAFGDPTGIGEKANYPAPCDYPNARNPMHSHAPVPRLLGKAPEWSNKNPSADFPGPGSYKPVDSVGPQVQSTKRTAGAASFGLGQRPNALYRDKQLKAGPGDYKIVDSMGVQAESTRKTAPAATIRSRRTLKPKASSDRIGPGQYAVKQAMGKQIESKNRTAPAPMMSGRTKFGSMYYM